MSRLEETIIEEIVRIANLFAEKIEQRSDVLTAQALPSGVSVDDLTDIVDEWLLSLDSRVLLEVIVEWLEGSQRLAIELVNRGLAPAEAIIFTSESEAAQAYLAGARNRLVGIGDEVWEAARETLVEGMELGESIPQLAQRIRDTSDVVDPRARTIARTEVVSASNAGSLAVARASGVELEKEWIATFDERTRETHAIADGQKVPIDRRFDVGGDMLDFPGDSSGSPEEVINCRCTLGFHVLDEEETIAVVGSAGNVNTMGMITLRPVNPELLQVEDGDLSSELHLTLAYLDDIQDPRPFRAIARDISQMSSTWVRGRVAGYGTLGNEGAVVLFLNSEEEPLLEDFYYTVWDRFRDEQLKVSSNYTPWIPHLTLGYGIDPSSAEKFLGQTIVFDSVSFDLMNGFSERFKMPVIADNLNDPDLSQHEDREEEEVMDVGMSGNFAHWEGVIAVEGIRTGDGRMFQEGSLTWADLPSTFQWQKESSHGGINDVTVAVGQVTEIERQGRLIVGKGTIDLTLEDGRELFRRVTEWDIGGVSIVVDNPDNAEVEITITPEEINETIGGEGEPAQPVEVTVKGDEVTFTSARIRALTAVDVPAFSEAKIKIVQQEQEEFDGPLLAAAVRSHETATSDSSWDGPENERRLPSPMSVSVARNAYAWIDDSEVQEGEIVKAAGRFIHHEVDGNGNPGAANLQACRTGIAVLNGARGGTTIPDADRQGVWNHLAKHIRGAGEDPPELASVQDIETLVASAEAIRSPNIPPKEWFSEPKEVPEHGAIHVTDEGRIYGYLAPRNIQHRAFEHKVIVPMGNVDYSGWMNRTTFVLGDSGSERIKAGPITMDCGHASAEAWAGADVSSDHYENSCSIVASVCVGENRHGVWVAGALLPDLSTSQIQRILMCQLSGDWRRHREHSGMKELTGALLVPVPAFPVHSSTTIRMSQGQLVASAVPVMFRPEEPVMEAEEVDLSLAAKTLATSIGRDKETRLKEMAVMVRGEG
jgi:hypothetical protein